MVNACQGMWTNKMIEYNSIFGFFIHSCKFHLIYYYEFHEPTYGHRILKESFSIPYLPLYLRTLRKQRTKPEIYLLLPSLVFCGMGGDGECNLFSLFSHFQCYLVISMITPNGRFITQKKICLSMSDYHPESWNPMWSVSSILTGLLSFMMDESPTTGSVKTTVAEKQRLAKASLAFNCKNQNFRELFPEYVEKHTQQQQLMQQAELAVSSTSAGEEGTFLPNPNRSVAGSKDGNLQEEEAPKNTRKNKGPPFPTWLLLLLFSIFGVVMALPLLQS